MCNVKRCKKLKKEPCLYVVAAAEKKIHIEKKMKVSLEKT